MIEFELGRWSFSPVALSFLVVESIRKTSHGIGIRTSLSAAQTRST